MGDTSMVKGLLAVALIAVMAAAWLPVSRTSFAQTMPTQEKPEHYAYINGYPDDEIKPLNKISREETAVIFYRLMGEGSRKEYASIGAPFSDVDGARWSGDEISALYNAGIIQGYDDGSFRPEEPITRAEFAVMAARFERFQNAEAPGSTDGLVDVDKFEAAEGTGSPDTKNHWARQWIGAAVEKGWIRVFGDGTFRPENNIIRCEAMMLVNDALDRRVNGAGLLKGAKQWPDCAEDQWYYEIVLEATNSHDYERADRPKSTEKWTALRPSPTW
ncbi:MAG TPA: S-layer homology domain-containing protein [Bacillota bacterium]|nr:S-layer homology domain-containing protein [Bacillota bacterium]